LNFSSSVCYCFTTVSQPKKFHIKVEVDGATLNVEVDGPDHGPNVLLWHGAGCTLRMWDFAVERLIDKFRFIRFDVRGIGLSSETENPVIKKNAPRR
jgi:pimeloyl-ACP methyl ester carboxylesterase